MLDKLEIRWKHRVAGVAADDAGATLTIETPDGPYRLRCDYLVAADGARSPVRKALGHESRGQSFRDRFLIADVRMAADFPAERWFWFDPPFHPNQSVLLHRQPDDVWRIDFQLGWDADPALERQPERVIPRVQALLGKEGEIRARMGERLYVRLHADGVVPRWTGAVRRRQRARRVAVRGAGRKFRRAGCGQPRLEAAPGAGGERAPTACSTATPASASSPADENIRHSTRSTDFITPKSAASRAFRDAVLLLAQDCKFAPAAGELAAGCRRPRRWPGRR